jgi:Reverse transcriptase (RNA-dependent DNA polymerase)
MAVEVLRLIVSIAVEKDWGLGSMDVKDAYLQATGFNREINVRPPREEGDNSHLWRLEKTAYGLGDSGRLWFLTSFRNLKAHNLRSCSYDRSVFLSIDSTVYVTTQVDNFITRERKRAWKHSLTT